MGAIAAAQRALDAAGRAVELERAAVVLGGQSREREHVHRAAAFERRVEPVFGGT